MFIFSLITSVVAVGFGVAGLVAAIERSRSWVWLISGTWGLILVSWGLLWVLDGFRPF